MEHSKSQQPVALVTNAADYAGPPAVKALVEAGFRVFAHSRSASDAGGAKALAFEIEGVKYVTADEPSDLVEAVWQESGRIDAIISNDHFPAHINDLASTELTYLRDTLEALIVWPFSLLQSALPRLQTQGGGNLVMITSCRTRAPIAGGAVPDLARAAANALVRSLAVEFAKDDIAINAIAPNFLYSEAYYPRVIFLESTRGVDYVQTLVPSQRLARPEEIGEIIAFLATAKARFLTGAVVDFAGGWPATPPRPSEV